MTHIIHVHAAFVDKEALKKALNNDQAFAENEDSGIDPSTGSVENSQECVLRQKSEDKEQEIYDQRD
jgi:hypothetical protein